MPGNVLGKGRNPGRDWGAGAEGFGGMKEQQGRQPGKRIGACPYGSREWRCMPQARRPSGQSRARLQKDKEEVLENGLEKIFGAYVPE